LNKELTPEELKIAGRIAKRFSYQWRTIDPQDLNSELILWMLEHYETVNKWRFAMGGQGKLVVSLKRLAARYCANETAANIHKPLDTNFHYTIEQIERGLPFIWQDRPQTIAIRHEASSGENSTNAVAVLADLDFAFHSLNADYQNILKWRFQLNLNLKEIGELLGITDRAAKARIDRALEKLQFELGGPPLTV
jgi:RNA polymerase sigma factor (sigma-70 family)